MTQWLIRKRDLRDKKKSGKFHWKFNSDGKLETIDVSVYSGNYLIRFNKTDVQQLFLELPSIIATTKEKRNLSGCEGYACVKESSVST